MKIGRVEINGKEKYVLNNGKSFHFIEGKIRNDEGYERFLGDQDFFEKVQVSEKTDLKDVKWLPPIYRPGKIVCVGRNYMEHITEQGKKPEEKPLLFSKYPSNMIGHNSGVKFPRHGKYLDYEVELAVIIGKKMTNVKEDFENYLFGVTVANDLTMRDVQKSEKQWTRGKAFDGSLPIGPYIVTIDELNNLQDLEIWLKVNGEERQRANTSQMIYPIGELLAFITEAITLYPGDVVLTGTPSGVGYYMEPKATLNIGDYVSCGVENVGTLNFKVVK